MRRRDFLRLSAAGAAGAASAGALSWRRAQASPFGEFPDAARHLALPAELRAQSVLEVFLYGGLSPWETLYLVEEYGRPTDPDFPDQQFYTFLGGGDDDSVEAALDRCAFPTGEAMGLPFARDAAGADVKIGPFAHRLRQRPDLLARMRLLVHHHRLEPHEAAVPQALTGKPLGQPAAAGLGAHIQRFSLESVGARPAPYSYVFATGGLPGDNVSAAAATGLHPGSARPLSINITSADGFYELLGRAAVGPLDARDRYDQLMQVYTDQYRRRLRWKGAGEPVRSARFTDLSLAVEAVDGADAIAGVMDASLFVARGGQACGENNPVDVPGMSLEAARHLLLHPEQPARYCCVSDIGLYEASGGGGYDTHTTASRDTARNLDNLLRGLSAIINAPGEADPAKLDLDRTLIILNTEFGRTPIRQDGGTGRNHHPYGYVTALLGGPIREGQAGISGAIGPDGVATDFMLPAENRVAALLALGIWPFSPDAFAVSDVRGADGEEDAARLVTERALGVAP
ncbi:MAG TPA: DUF1501 domain-containing protein [Kofleriaceae bacterium]|nr:DUF1501 domain-containing protein [Kofleriaceae bacterium]